MADFTAGGAGFRCQRCSNGCCARFKITVTAEEKDRLLRLNIPGTPPAEQCFLQESPLLFTVAKKADTGDCVFSGGGSCRIQELYGFKAKPAACQLFPLHVRSWADGVISAEYRWICPGVGVPEGKRIAEETNLPAYARVLDKLRSREHAVFSGSLDPGLAAIRAVHAGIVKIMHREDVPLACRFYCALRVLDFHADPAQQDVVRNAGKAFAADAGDFLEAMKRYPDTIFMQGHIGGGGDWQWNLRTLEKLQSDNYYIDLSGSVVDHTIIRATVDTVGADRVLFATDGWFEEAIGKLQGARLSKKEEKMICSENFEKLMQRRKGLAKNV